MKVVQFDMDGVIIDSTRYGLCRLDERLYNIPFLTYDYNNSLNFDNIKDPYILKEISKDKPQGILSFDEIMNLWEDPRIIDARDLDVFARGIIKELSEYCKVIVRTISFNDEIGKRKQEVLGDEILNLSNFEFHNIVKSAEANVTKAVIDCDYYIDDFMGNLLKYDPAKTNLFLLNRMYNQEIYNPMYKEHYGNANRIYGLSQFKDAILANI